MSRKTRRMSALKLSITSCSWLSTRRTCQQRFWMWDLIVYVCACLSKDCCREIDVDLALLPSFTGWWIRLGYNATSESWKTSSGILWVQWRLCWRWVPPSLESCTSEMKRNHSTSSMHWSCWTLHILYVRGAQQSVLVSVSSCFLAGQRQSRVEGLAGLHLEYGSLEGWVRERRLKAWPTFWALSLPSYCTPAGLSLTRIILWNSSNWRSFLTLLNKLTAEVCWHLGICVLFIWPRPL